MESCHVAPEHSLSADDDRQKKEFVEWAIAPSTLKIFPDTFPEGRKEANIYGAQKEYVSFQIVLRSEKELLLSIQSPLETFEVVYISTPETAEWGYSGKEYTRPVYPDPLVPTNTIHLQQDVTKSIWVRVKIDQSKNTVVRIGDLEIPVNITSWDWKMPTSPSLQTAIGLESEGLAQYYNVDRHSKEFRKIYRQYYDALLDYRLSAYHLPYSLDDPRAEEYMTDPRVTTFRVDRGLTPDLWESIQSLGAEEKSWVLIFDEPTTISHYKEITENARGWHNLYPGIRYAMTFYDHAQEGEAPFEILSNSVNLWAFQTDYYTRIEDKARQKYKEGDEIWLYTALAPREGWCNILLNHTALEHRLLFWQIFSKDIVTGYLFWHATYWDEVDNPWTDQATVKNIDPALWGDGSLFYPLPDGPAGSMRLELMRAGLQDFELLKKAEKTLGEKKVNQYIQRLTTSFTDYTQDVDTFEKVRRKLGGKIPCQKD